MADLQNVHPQLSQSSSCLSTPSCLPCKQEEPGLRAGNAQGQPQSSAVHLEHGLELSANKQTLNTLLCAEASANPPLRKGQSGWLIRHPRWMKKKCARVRLHPPRAWGHFLCKSGTMRRFDCCCRCQEPSKQQILEEEKQGQGAEGQSCGHGTNVPPLPSLLIPMPNKKDFSRASLAEGMSFSAPQYCAFNLRRN